MYKKKIRTYIKNVELVKERRSQIFLSAAKLFLKHGYDSTSVRELADSVGISKNALYQYIGTKADIVHLLLEFIHDSDTEFMEATKTEITGLKSEKALNIAIEKYISHVDKVQDAYNFSNHIVASLSREHRETIFQYYENLVKFFEEIIIEGVRKGEFKNICTRLASQDIVLVSQAWASRRWSLKRDFTLSDYSKIQTELILTSLVNDVTH